MLILRVLGGGVMVHPGAMKTGDQGNPMMEDQVEIKIMVPSTKMVLDCGMICILLDANLSSVNLI